MSVMSMTEWVFIIEKEIVRALVVILIGINTPIGRVISQRINKDSFF